MAKSGRDSAAGRVRGSSNDLAGRALELMEKALGLIDANNGPNDAGAHLDLAIHRLREWIKSGRS